MIYEIAKISIIAIFCIAVGAALMNSGHKDTLLFILGIAALIYVITEMKGQKVLMGEG